MSTGKRCRLKVIGKVQGVCFRANTQQRARRLELTGWVRNCEDGSVVAEAQGNQSSIEAFIRFCREGPELSQVDSVVVEEISLQEGEEDFAIQR